VALATARLAVPACLLVVAVSLSVVTQRITADASSPYPLSPTPVCNAALAGLGGPALDLGAITPAPVPEEHTLRRGETLGGILRGLGFEPAEAVGATRALAEHLDVTRMRAGDPWAAYYSFGDHRLASVEFPVPGEGRVVLARNGDGWRSDWHPFQRRVLERRVRGEVEDSLISAVVKAGASPILAYRMADVLAWDMDFSRDLRSGDTFEVVYEEIELDGRTADLGNIWALTFDNGGRRLEAYRFEDAYYDGEGRPLKKMFLRSPLRYSFVTSRFTNSRFHPVLKTYRPHWGVDYRAKVGTPVRVTAGGVVTFAGWGKGSGKMVKVRHPNGFVTAYLHLSRFASGIRPGRRVSQGEVVAYSGNTGLSTAPHLDYRVQKNGRWINPLSLDNVPAEPIPEARLADFMSWRDACRESLAGGRPLPELRPELAPAGGETDPGVVVAGLDGATDSASADLSTAGR
jgi:murein DD-endopeptidase MepM/ murein hydrolase activator NlpD